MNRRKFINSLIATGGIASAGATVYPVATYLYPPEQAEVEVNSLKVGKVDEHEINSAKIVRFGRVPVILIRNESGDFIAFAATCTHLDCIVQYRQDSKQIVCACHNGIYDLGGKNISGPPPKPLQEYNVIVKNDEVIITV